MPESFICTLEEIDLSRFKDDEYVTPENTLKVPLQVRPFPIPGNKEGHIEIHSVSRYGFRKKELLDTLVSYQSQEFSENDRVVIVAKQNEIPYLAHYGSIYVAGEMKMGICAGRPLKSSLKYLNSLGLTPIKYSDHERDLRFRSLDYLVDSTGSYTHIDYVLVKSADIINMTKLGEIDAVICYGDVWYNLPEPNYNIKYLNSFVDELGFGETYVSLIANKGFNLKSCLRNSDEKIRVFSEYNDGERLMRKYIEDNSLSENNFEFLRVQGAVEGYLHANMCDMAITVVQTGDTLNANELELVTNLRRIYLNMWSWIKPRRSGFNEKIRVELYRHFMPKHKQKYFIIDGIDGTGKTTLLSNLEKFGSCQQTVFFDRFSPITYATDTSSPLPEEGNIDEMEVFKDTDTTILFLEADLDLCDKRLKDRLMEGEELEKHETYNFQCYYRLRFRQLAALNGYHVMDVTDMSEEEVVNEALNILRGSDIWKVPNMREMTQEKFNSLEFVIQGESKIIRNWNDRFDIIRYKPSVYSHKAQRGATVEGSDIERQSVTVNIELLLALSGIPHTYWCIINGFILAKAIRNVPDIEVIVKAAHEGTHKHMYYGMQGKMTRFGKPFVLENNMYKAALVRYDWRNVNHIKPGSGQTLLDLKHAQMFITPMRKKGMTDEEILEVLEAEFPNGVPLGDYPLSDDTANEFINVRASKPLVKKAFNVLSQHFKNMNLRFKDVCFMVTEEGDTLYSEVSQDCGRYEAIDPSKEAFQKCFNNTVEIPWEEDNTSLDKDVFRSGGSSPLVLEKWKRLTFLVKEYTKQYLEDYTL